MSITDVAAQNASLDNDYGPTHGSHAPAWHDLALLDADGTELTADTAPGYGRARIVQADWPAAVGALKALAVTFAAPTDEWPVAWSWQLYGGDGLAWDAGDLADPLLVTSASDVGPVVTVGIYYTPNL